MRVFNLVREEDESGVSGTGIVAQGTEFDNGRVALTWLKSHLGMVGIYDNITVMLKVHGHGGKTKVEWVYDTDPGNSADETLAVEDPVTETTPRHEDTNDTEDETDGDS